jgi:hypothetical protein
MKRFVPGIALALAALLAACSGDRRLPTAPDESAAAQATNAASEAKGGKKPKPGNTLSVQLQPDVWNTNYTNSQGTVSALIEGKDLDKIDTSTIVLIGDGGDPVEPRRVQVSGPHIRAFFGKGDVIESLDDPKRGEVHEVRIEFTQDGAAVSLTAEVRIVGPAGGGGDDDDAELEMEIQPDHWNINWKHSRGTVTALIRGDGLGQIDLESFELVGTDPAAAPVAALRAKRSGNHVRAFFAQSEAIATLDTPKRGESHDVTIRFDGPGGANELVDTILVVGPNR